MVNFLFCETVTTAVNEDEPFGGHFQRLQNETPSSDPKLHPVNRVRGEEYDIGAVVPPRRREFQKRGKKRCGHVQQQLVTEAISR